ncbi:MAG: alkaline phosphatase [Leptolyngbyaceae cyanobacterium bins.59]|nr:alkaline phosphatase [Leptolyngbyaceae cyanobacterium bins.59]
MAGNHVIFIHPDGIGPSGWTATRALTAGPDGRLNWDRLDNSGTYLGHMQDQLGGTSNGGAVTHATGVKVYAESFGLDRQRDASGQPIDLDPSPSVVRFIDQPLTSLSGRTNRTIMQEAVEANKVTALINSGFIAEPGTGAFVAQVGYASVPTGATGFGVFPRAQFAEITRQVIESGVDIILGGGELHYLPEGTTGRHVTAAIDANPANRGSSNRPSTNLITRAQSLGYTVVYTRDELFALLAQPNPPQKVLGIFAAIHTFNDFQEERLNTTSESGLGRSASTTTPAPLYVPTAPTVAEMLDAAQKLMERNSKFRNGSLTVLEEEGTDNFGNTNNAAGMLEAARRTDAAYGVAMDFIKKYPNTLMVTAADSEAGGLQIWQSSPVQSATANVGTIGANPVSGGASSIVTGDPTSTPTSFSNPLDGVRGRETPPFISAPDRNGNTFPFAIAWAGTPDFSGAIVAKAHGLNADRLPETVDNTDIYRMMYETLFPERGRLPAARVGPTPPLPTPAIGRTPAANAQGNMIFIHPDGAGHSIWGATRIRTVGADGRLHWDTMSNSGVYAGHLTDRLVGSSDGSAVTHAMGVKAWDDSYGFRPDGTTLYTPLSGAAPGTTILEEALAAGKAIAIINSGTIAEPGSGAFLAQVANRGNAAEITQQIIEAGNPNRPGARADERIVILGGGELNYLPAGQNTTNNPNARHVTAAIDAAHPASVYRPTRDLIALARSYGFTVVYTLAELQAATANPATAPRKLLGIFSSDDTYDDRTEEALRLNTANPLSLYRADNFSTSGNPVNPTRTNNTTPSAVAPPPTIGQMLDAALRVVSQDPDGFALVAEEEGTDNFANANNAVGTLEAARRADEAIGIAMRFTNDNPNTLVITTADSEAGGLQVFQPVPFAPGYPVPPGTLTTPPTVPVNPTGLTGATTPQNPVDGERGRTAPWVAFNSPAILSDPAQSRQPFSVAWAGTPDFAGSIHVKAHGRNADLLPQTVDNTDIYRLSYLTLFGRSPDPTVLRREASKALMLEGGIGTVNLQVTLTGQRGGSVNEIGVFEVDDANGTINGIAPSDSRYLATALGRGRILMSAINNNPQNFDPGTLRRLLGEIDRGSRLVFYQVENGTTDGALAAIAARRTPPTITFSTASGVTVDQLTGSNRFQVAFNSITLTAETATAPAALGTALQSSQEGEVIDLRGITGQVRAEFTVNREAAFDNFVGFYRVDDARGTIGTLAPGSGQDYIRAALDRLVPGLNLSVANQGRAQFTAQLTGGGIFAPLLITNGGTIDQARNGTLNAENNQGIYFPYLGANFAGADHFRILGENIWGIEDLRGGGDADYNDVIISARLTAI